MAIKNSKMKCVINIKIQKSMIVNDEILSKAIQLSSLTDVWCVFSKMGARAKRISPKGYVKWQLCPKECCYANQARLRVTRVGILARVSLPALRGLAAKVLDDDWLLFHPLSPLHLIPFVPQCPTKSMIHPSCPWSSIFDPMMVQIIIFKASKLHVFKSK